MRRVRLTWIFLLIAALALANCCAWAEAPEGAEAELRARLTEASGWPKFEQFYCADYDGDGSLEAFALAGESDDFGGYSGRLWFVSELGATPLGDETSYLHLQIEGDAEFKLFSAEEWHGGSGSWSHNWYVRDAEPRELDVDSISGFTYDGGNQFSNYPDAFDMYSDGTGHTWKRYYYYFDPESEGIREYGGLQITEEQLAEWSGAEEILEAARSRGWAIGEIYYRANSVINVNLYQDSGARLRENDNLTLRVEGERVVDTGESYSYGGSYAPANDPDIAAFPERFPAPGEGASEEAAPEEEAAPGEEEAALGAEAPSLPDLDVFEFDRLSPEYVLGSEMAQDGALQDCVVHLRPDVNSGGSDGYFENWVTDEGTLCDAMIDLDGDGQEEYLIYEALIDGEEGSGAIAVYEARDGAYEEADRIEGVGTLMPMGTCEIRLVNAASGIQIAVAHYGMYDGAASYFDATIYSYDGTSLRPRLCAEVGDSLYVQSWVLKEPEGDIQLSALQEAVQDYSWEGDSFGLRQLGLTAGENILIYSPDDADYGYGHDQAGFDMLAGALAPHNLDLRWTIAGGEYDYIEEIELSGGEIFLRVEDGYQTTDDTRLVLRTTLDHRPGSLSSEGGEFDIGDWNGGSSGARATGDVNVRSGPGLDYDSVTVLNRGETVEYLGEESVDDRGVAWYHIRYYGTDGWASSKYVVLE